MSALTLMADTASAAQLEAALARGNAGEVEAYAELRPLALERLAAREGLGSLARPDSARAIQRQIQAKTAEQRRVLPCVEEGLQAGFSFFFFRGCTTPRRGQTAGGIRGAGFATAWAVTTAGLRATPSASCATEPGRRDRRGQARKQTAATGRPERVPRLVW